MAMSTLDPLGLPLTITTVAGNTADDPLYLPEIDKIRQIAQIVGLTYVGDCKMAALGTRAQIVAYQDFYLCPLSAKQMPEAELDRLLEPAFNRQLKPVEIRLPDADGQIDQTDDPVAIGFEYRIEQSGQDRSGKTQTWQERRLVVRSLALAESQEKNLRQRAASAVKQINKLDERKKGKKPLPDEAAAKQAAEAIIVKYRVEGLITVSVRTEIEEQEKRRYGSRPATTVQTERVRVSAEQDEAAVKQAARRLAWRVYATNHTAEELSLAQAVAAYRSEYLIEQGFGRLKGRSLSLTPLFLHFETRIVGLISLLSIALRVVVLIQFVVRRNLQKEGTTLKGIYPGQPGRQTKSPTTEMMLRAFRGLTLSRIRVNGQAQDHLTPLNGTQKRILKLMEVPLESYSCLVT
jgi:transposase